MCQSKSAGGKRCKKQYSTEALDYFGEAVLGLPEQEFGKLLTGIRRRESELHKIMMDKSSDTEAIQSATEEWNALTDGMDPKDYKYGENADLMTKRNFWQRFRADMKKVLSPKKYRTLARRIARAMQHNLPTGLIRSFEKMKELVKNRKSARLMATSIGVGLALALTACGGGNTDNNDNNPAPTPTTSQSQSATPSATAAPSATWQATASPEEAERILKDAKARPFDIDVDDVMANRMDRNPNFPLKTEDVYPSKDFNHKEAVLTALNFYQDVSSISQFQHERPANADKTLLSTFGDRVTKPVYDNFMSKGLTGMFTVDPDGTIGEVNGVVYHASEKESFTVYGQPEVYTESTTGDYSNVLTVHGFYDRTIPTKENKLLTIPTEYWISVVPSNGGWIVSNTKVASDASTVSVADMVK